MSLYLRISDNEICFAKYDSVQSAVFEFEKYHVRPQVSLTVNLREAMENISLLKEKYDEVQVFVNSPVTLVPLAEFQEEDVEKTYKYCFSKNENKRIFYDTVPAANLVLLSALDTATCRTLEDTFGGIRYMASLAPLLQHFANKAIDEQMPKRSFVYVHDGIIDVCAFDETRLLALNSYKVTSLSDADYYIFNFLRHLSLSLEDTPLYVVGEDALSQPLAAELELYASKVYTINPAADFNRHVIAVTEGVPYDMMCGLLK